MKLTSEDVFIKNRLKYPQDKEEQKLLPHTILSETDVGKMMTFIQRQHKQISIATTAPLILLTRQEPLLQHINCIKSKII